MNNRKSVLLVEDNEKLSESNRRALELKGYHVHVALNLKQAREHLKSHDPDVILLDVTLPDGDGIHFCREIYGSVTSHIIFLTAKTEQHDRIRGLEYGGDDYITKPYKLGELLARVGAVMRRRQADAKKLPVQIVTVGPLTLNIVAGKAYMNSEDLLLTPKEFALLLILAGNDGKTITAENLYKEVWKQEMTGDANAIKNAIYRLRKKLEACGDSFHIAMTRGEGYCFTAVVSGRRESHNTATFAL